MVKNDRTYLWVLIIHVILKNSHGAFFKMSKMECRDVNEDLVHVNACRLKAVKRDIAEATVRFQLKKTVQICNLHIELLRKYNTYQPFFINRTFDACKFLKNRKNAVYFDILFKLIEKYTNANHTCPYEGELIIDRFRPLHNNLMLALPTGDYLIKFGFYNLNTLMVYLDVWFGFKELEIWEVGRVGVSTKNTKTLN